MISYENSLKLCSAEELLSEYNRVLKYGKESYADIVQDEILRRLGVYG